MQDEAKLIEKLRLIEALFAGAATEGERQAAAEARERIRARLGRMEREEPPIEHRFTLVDLWSRRLLVALLRRYGIEPYRYARQRRTTVMARAPRRFVDETLWPEFTELDRTLRAYLDEATERIIATAVHGDRSEATVTAEPAGAPAGSIEP